ncbi:MAG TPA: prolipoprotein diacylglyceryl transferase family protein [Vicinamibacterales bacterium]
MTFPIWIPLGPLRVHPHLFFELSAYLVAGLIYWRRRRSLGDHVSTEARWALAAAAVVGAVVGSRMLFWFEDPQRTLSQLTNPQYLAGGQTIVGALIGGWIAVEWQKRRIGILRPTGDLFAISIALGAGIGRIGCFLSGLPDGTYGVRSSLPWAIDLGDGIPRHPTALYESIFMFALAFALMRFERRAILGELFLGLIAAYLAFRTVVDFWKPGVPLVAGLTAIQVASLLGFAVTLRVWAVRRRSVSRTLATETG